MRSCCQGIDIKEMLVGAALMDEETRNTVVWHYKNTDNLQCNDMVTYRECVMSNMVSFVTG